MYTVLEKRQLALKISANSVYGALGTKTGLLPFIPAAQSVTALGRTNIQNAATYMQRHCGAQLVYGDTDSVYVNFPAMDNASVSQLWDHCLDIEQRVNQVCVLLRVLHGSPGHPVGCCRRCFLSRRCG